VRANVESHRGRIVRARERVLGLAERGERAIQQLLAQRAAALEHCGQLLNALSHRGVLARGFALIRDLKRRPVRKAAAIGAGMAVDIEFYDGYVRATAEQSFTTAEKPQPAPKSRRGNPGQGSLFG
jgi:exodeoxyribonuclease VII large subunit